MIHKIFVIDLGIEPYQYQSRTKISRSGWYQPISVPDLHGIGFCAKLYCVL